MPSVTLIRGCPHRQPHFDLDHRILHALASGGTPASGVTSVTIPAGQSTVSFYYGDTDRWNADALGRLGRPPDRNSDGDDQPGSRKAAGLHDAAVHGGRRHGFTVGVTVEDQFGNTITTGNAGSTDSIELSLSSNSFAAGTTTFECQQRRRHLQRAQDRRSRQQLHHHGHRPDAHLGDPGHFRQFTVTPPPPSQLVFTSTSRVAIPWGQRPMSVHSRSRSRTSSATRWPTPALRSH